MSRIRIGRIVIDGDPSRHRPEAISRAVEREVLRVLAGRGRAPRQAQEIARKVASQVLAKGIRK